MAAARRRHHARDPDHPAHAPVRLSGSVAVRALLDRLHGNAEGQTWHVHAKTDIRTMENKVGVVAGDGLLVRDGQRATA